MLTNAESLLSFKPSKLSSAPTRIGGGTRGSNVKGIDLQVLAPLQTGLTSQAAPILYWYISDTPDYPIEITLNLENQIEPIIEKLLPPVTTAGIQAINLQTLGVNLEVGKEYRWSVALITDSSQRSSDIFTSAAIRRETTNIAFDNVEKLANEGFWYDVLAQLIQQNATTLNVFLNHEGITLGGREQPLN